MSLRAYSFYSFFPTHRNYRSSKLGLKAIRIKKVKDKTIYIY